MTGTEKAIEMVQCAMRFKADTRSQADKKSLLPLILQALKEYQLNHAETNQ